MAEVLVALVLLAVVLVPLAEAVESALARARGVQRQAVALSSSVRSEDVPGPWKWGPRVVRGVWGPGPVLDLQTDAGSEGGAIVGAWADGWFIGEQTTDGEGRLELKAFDLRDFSGAELIVRVRGSEGVWGPPWRTLVADGMGRPPLSEGGGVASTSGTSVQGCVLSAVHPPSLSRPTFAVPGSVDVLEPAAAGVPYVLPLCPGGAWGIELGESSQSWFAETGRALDIYF